MAQRLFSLLVTVLLATASIPQALAGNPSCRPHLPPEQVRLGRRAIPHLIAVDCPLNT